MAADRQPALIHDVHPGRTTATTTASSGQTVASPGTPQTPSPSRANAAIVTETRTIATGRRAGSATSHELVIVNGNLGSSALVTK